MCERMGLNVEDVRMWDYHNDTKLKILEDPLCTLVEERILDNQKLLFEERLPDGKWPKLATKRDREFDAKSMVKNAKKRNFFSSIILLFLNMICCRSVWNPDWCVFFFFFFKKKKKNKGCFVFVSHIVL